MYNIERASKTLWAKVPEKTGEEGWLSLMAHMEEVAEVAKLLWDNWLPSGVKQVIEVGCKCDARQVLVLLAYLHDIGKATPSFQARGWTKIPDVQTVHRTIIDAGLELPKGVADTGVKHAGMGYYILKDEKFDISLALVVGGHHGKYPGRREDKLYASYPNASGRGVDTWLSVQKEFISKGKDYSGLHDIEDIKLSKGAQVLMTGIVIMADWLASDVKHCPFVKLTQATTNAKNRADRAYQASGLHGGLHVDIPEDVYSKRFNFEEARLMQKDVLALVKNIESPGLIIVESPTGSGKTEASLAIAEVLSERTGRRGLYYALPTQATSNAMFSRVLNWLRTFDTAAGSISVKLAHGNAIFNDEYMGVDEVDGVIDSPDETSTALVRNTWMRGRHTSLFSDYTVGTVDQLLMLSLKTRFLQMRHLALSTKVVVIDEVHSYDAYMSSYLGKALSWLGAYGVPVIVLSATLTVDARKKLVKSYLGIRGRTQYKDPDWLNSRSYPSLTYTEGDTATVSPVGRENDMRDVSIDKLDEENLVTLVKEKLVDGGCIGIIANTVRRAQHIYDEILRDVGKEYTKLLHSGYTSIDRACKEKELVELLGPKQENRPDKLVVVGTQVLEQSLDLDFDLMIIDLCPMDLLLQRIGRLHRHTREVRPSKLENPKCYVMGATPEKLTRGSVYVYGKYLLMQTILALPDKVKLPDDVTPLIDSVYVPGQLEIPEKILSAHREEYQRWCEKVKGMESRASEYQIDESCNAYTDVYGWQENPKKDVSTKKSKSNFAGVKRGEAVVREGVSSLEVVLVQRVNGELRTLPWVLDGTRIEKVLLKPDMSKELVGCSVRLPVKLGLAKNSDRVIGILEQALVDTGLLNKWQASRWLHGELPLILDESYEARVGNFVIKYDQDRGISYREED